MVFRYENDDYSEVYMQDGYLTKNIQTCRDAFVPRSVYKNVQPIGDSAEEVFAFIQAANHRKDFNRLQSGQHNTDFCFRVPVDVWVIGEPYRFRPALDGLFKREPPQTNYRLSVTVVPKQFEGQRLAVGANTGIPQKRRPSVLRARAGNWENIFKNCESATDFFLEEIMKDYREGGPEAIHRLMNESGHEWWHSNGLIS